MSGCFQALEIPRQMLPEVLQQRGLRQRQHSGPADSPSPELPATSRRPQFGQGCFCPGQAQNTYGTGCFLLMNTGTEPCRNDSV